MFVVNAVQRIVWVSMTPLEAGAVLFPDEAPGLILRVHRPVSRQEAAAMLGVPPPDRFQHFYECSRVHASAPVVSEFGAN